MVNLGLVNIDLFHDIIGAIAEKTGENICNAINDIEEIIILNTIPIYENCVDMPYILEISVTYANEFSEEFTCLIDVNNRVKSIQYNIIQPKDTAILVNILKDVFN